MATWCEMISQEMAGHCESFNDVISSTLTEEQLNTDPDIGFHSEGLEFTIWTKNRVYFPAKYDGVEWCASVSRNPDGKPTVQVGGD